MLKHFERRSQQLGSLTLIKRPITDVQLFDVLYFNTNAAVRVNFSVSMTQYLKVTRPLQMAYAFNI